MASTTNRQILLKSRPNGQPGTDNFELVERPVPEPSEGQVLLRTLYLSLDPYMRGRMNDAKSYAKPAELGQPMVGGTVSEVVASRNAKFAVGDIVLAYAGWQDYALADGAGLRKLDPQAAPLSTALGILGMPGMTAYCGLLEIGKPLPGETVVVAAASGAVGSAVGQIAKLKGAGRVIGSAGSDEKVRWLREIGYDAAFNYRTAPVLEQLREAAPDGIDVYFDNVGADHLDAALVMLNNHGRVAMCGAIASYNATEPPVGPSNLGLVVSKRLTLRGFIIIDHQDRLPDMVADVSAWLREGKIAHAETVVDGLDRAPGAFIDLLRGANTGKMLVRL